MSNPIRDSFIEHYGYPDDDGIDPRKWQVLYELYEAGWQDATDRHRQVIAKLQEIAAEVVRLVGK